ncbi:MAG: CHAT domain-containing tetratricopeptide repeat protein [Chitinophagales bacterium]
MKNKNIDNSAKLRFWQAEAENYRKAAKFKEALALHQKVFRESKKNVKDSMIFAYANYYVSASYERLYESDSAFIYVNKALKLFEKSLPEDHIKLGPVYNMVAVCYYRKHDIDNAERYYLKSIDVIKKNLDGPSYLMSMAYGNLASCANVRADYLGAIAYSEKALAINKQLEERDGMSYNYYSMAVNYYYLGDYGRSKDYLIACIDLRKKIYNNENHYRFAGPYEVLGINYEESRDYVKAIEYLKKAKAIKIGILGENSTEVAFSNENIATCHLQLGAPDSALYYISLATPILEKNIPGQYELSTHYFTLSRIKIAIKEYDAALKTLEKSTNIQKNLGLVNSSEYAQNLGVKAHIFSKQKKFIEAQQLFEKSLSILAIDSIQSYNYNSFPLNAVSLDIINDVIEHSFEAYNQTKEEKYLRQLQQFSEIFMAVSNNYRKQFNDPYTKNTIALKNIDAIEMGVGISYKLYNDKKSDALKEQVFKYAEMGRSALLRDLIDDYKIKSFAGIPDSLLKKEERLKLVLSDLNQQLMEQPNNLELRQELFAQKEAFNRHIENLVEINPHYYNLKFNNQVASIDQIKNEILKTNDNLIEYATDDTAYYALLINNKKSEVYHLGNKRDIDKTVEAWRTAITSLQQNATNKLGVQLYKTLFQPIEKDFSGEKIIIIPNGSLFYLNFEALKKDITQTDYLIHEYDIHYALSGNVLLEQSKLKKKSTGLPIIVAPGFESEIKANYQKSIGLSEEIDTGYINTVRQPWSVKMANYMSKNYKGNALIGEAASETNVLKSLNNNSIIHFATHAIANEEDPLRSKLVLAKDLGENENDGYLHAYEFYNLSLQSELAVLTACESGIGNIQKGEGMISLAYSMNFAGCPSVIMSLWKIDEKTNTEITSYFYKYLAKGETINSALRLAKLDYLDKANGTLKHPFYWSGLVLMGNNNTIDMPSKRLNWRMIWPISFLIAGFLVFTFFNLRRRKTV